MPPTNGVDDQTSKVSARPTPERRRRSDAERNIEAILRAGVLCLQEDPDASMTAIAQAAGVSRVTLYTHFPSREQLVNAALDRVLAEADKDLENEALNQLPAPEALSRLMRSQWHILDRHRSMLAAALRVLSHRQLKERHHDVLERVDKLIVRGQREGTIRTDLPRSWLVTVFHSLLHIAADEVNAGRLRRREVADILDATLTAALAASAPK
jgi:TetR/AcrR family transcriptional regulator, mexCD-oprJ operon repressor